MQRSVEQSYIGIVENFRTLVTLQSCRIGCKWFRGKFGNGAHIALQPNRSPNKSKLFDQSNILISSIRIWSSIHNDYLFWGISFLFYHRKGIMKWQFSWLATILFTFPSHWTIIWCSILQFNFLILKSGWTKLCKHLPDFVHYLNNINIFRILDTWNLLFI